MSLASNVVTFATRVGTEFKTIRTLITGSGTGDLTGLTTTTKTSVVAALNEVNAKPSSAPPNASTTVPGIIEIATLAEVGTGTSAVLAVTPQGVKQETDAVKSFLLGPGAPAALDTIDELAAAIGDDGNFATTMTTALGNRVRTDTAAQGLNTTQQSNARTNIAVYSTTEIGDPNTDFAAAFVAALA